MNLTIAMVVMLAVWPFHSAKDYRMTSDSAVPAAQGMVRIQKDKDNGNTKVDIKVDHLARPSSLTPSASDYIVWLRQNNGETAKQGAIGVDKNLSGELKLETVSKEFDVLITAEQSDNVSAPSDVQVLHAHVSTD